MGSVGQDEKNGLKKMLVACQGLALRLRVISEHVYYDSELQREVRLAAEAGEELVQCMSELAAKNVEKTVPKRPQKHCRNEGCPKTAEYCWPDATECQLCPIHKMKGMDRLADRRDRAGDRCCEHSECTENAAFNFQGEKRGRYCFSHKLEGMVLKLSPKKCEVEVVECGNLAIFNFEGEPKGKFCHHHKFDGMVKINSVQCLHTGCLNKPTHNFPGRGTTTKLFCNEHKLKGMVRHEPHKSCRHPGCTIKASFHFQGSTAKFCLKHKQEGMVSKNPTCQHEGCGITNPSFNFEDSKKGTFCLKHKLQGMVNVADKRCEHSGCDKSRTFNFSDQKLPRFCGQHKLEGMINVAHKKRLRCAQGMCEKMAYFNFEGEHRKGKFCLEHKVEGMVDVVNPCCGYAGCNKRSSFNFVSERRPKFCAQHKLPEMVSLISKCSHPGCGKHGGFNFQGLGHKGGFCMEHKLEGMNSHAGRLCEGKDCNKRRAYNIPGEKKGRFCRQHMLPGMVNVEERTCEHSDCYKRPSCNFDGQKVARFCGEHKLPFMINIFGAAAQRRKKLKEG